MPLGQVGVCNPALARSASHGTPVRLSFRRQIDPELSSYARQSRVPHQQPAILPPAAPQLCTD